MVPLVGTILSLYQILAPLVATVVRSLAIFKRACIKRIFVVVSSMTSGPNSALSDVSEEQWDVIHLQLYMPHRALYWSWSDNCCFTRTLYKWQVSNPISLEVKVTTLHHVLQNLYHSLSLPVYLRMISYTQVKSCVQSLMQGTLKPCCKAGILIWYNKVQHSM